jgi:hypothetical protein
MNTIENYFFDKFNFKNLNLNISEEAQRYYHNAQADAIHCYQSIEKYLYKDKKILEVGGVFICLPVFYTKIMILPQLNREALLVLQMNYEIKF